MSADQKELKGRIMHAIASNTTPKGSVFDLADTILKIVETFYVIPAATQAPSAPVVREVPEGWQLVPKEPTTTMMDGAFDNISLSDAHSTYGVTEHVWAFMLAAAPNPPQPGEAT